MNIFSMKIFKTIAEIKDIAEVSKKVNMSQLAVRKVIDYIEFELNSSLFDRIDEDVVLNYHGKKLLEHITIILTEYDKIIEYFNSCDKKDEDSLKNYGLDADLLDNLF